MTTISKEKSTDTPLTLILFLGSDMVQGLRFSPRTFVFFPLIKTKLSYSPLIISFIDIITTIVLDLARIYTPACYAPNPYWPNMVQPGLDINSIRNVYSYFPRENISHNPSTSAIKKSAPAPKMTTIVDVVNGNNNFDQPLLPKGFIIALSLSAAFESQPKNNRFDTSFNIELLEINKFPELVVPVFALLLNLYLYRFKKKN